MGDRPARQTDIPAVSAQILNHEADGTTRRPAPRSVSGPDRRQRLKRVYLGFLAPAAAAFVGLVVFRSWVPEPIFGISAAPETGVVIFVLAIGSAAALPIFLRSLFAHRWREQRQVAEKDFFQLQRAILLVTLPVPYLALIACLLSLPRLHLAGTVLAALYAVYYHYPSDRRIEFDRRIFRVRSSELP